MIGLRYKKFFDKKNMIKIETTRNCATGSFHTLQCVLYKIKIHLPLPKFENHTQTGIKFDVHISAKMITMHNKLNQAVSLFTWHLKLIPSYF